MTDNYEAWDDNEPASVEEVGVEIDPNLGAEAILEDKLGVKLDELNPVDESVSTEEEPTNVDFEKFSTDFEKHLGFNIKDAQKMVAELQEFRNHFTIEQQKVELRQEWGESFDSNFDAVKSYFKRLSPQQQAALDNPDGARLIHARLTQAQTPRGANVPTFASSRGNPLAAKVVKETMKYSDIVNMNEREYKQRSAEIALAMEEGRVIMDY